MAPTMSYYVVAWLAMLFVAAEFGRGDLVLGAALALAVGLFLNPERQNRPIESLQIVSGMNETVDERDFYTRAQRWLATRFTLFDPSAVDYRLGFLMGFTALAMGIAAWNVHHAPSSWEVEAKRAALSACAQMPSCVAKAERFTGGNEVFYYIAPSVGARPDITDAELEGVERLIDAITEGIRQEQQHDQAAEGR